MSRVTPYIVSGRRVIVETPTPVVRGEPLNVILLFHGHGGDADQFRRQTALDRFVDSSRLCCVWLDGTPDLGAPRSWNAGPGSGYAFEHKIDDMGFVSIRVLPFVSDVVRRAGWARIERQPFAWGFSNGAVMAARVACQLPGGVRGLVTCAATQSYDWQPRPSPTPALHVHGLGDGVSRYEGGMMPEGYIAWSAAAHQAWWQRTNKPTPSVPAQFIPVPNCGHDWPGPGERPDYSFLPPDWQRRIGPEQREWDLTAAALSFCGLRS